MPRKRTKYIFVSGGVLSSLGKGLTTASLGMLLQAKGYRVTIVKCENYLNLDAGLINPIEHGDAFLCEDGTEADMDLGNYERFLGRDLGRHNFVTLGQIYKSVIERERNFGYNGEDVEAIPHVTDEIIARLKYAANQDQADICIVELGGTVGEYQNVLYYEAARIMKVSGGETVAHVHVSYMPTPSHIGEPKTKPTQLSVKQLNAMGIQPDYVVVRGEYELDSRRRERLALFCSVPPSHVINNPDLDTIYALPLVFHAQKLDSQILSTLSLKDKPSNLREWQAMVAKIRAPRKKRVKVAIVGKYFETGNYLLVDSYAALVEALNHAASRLGCELEIKHINSKKIETQGTKSLEGANGIIVPIGWGPRGTEGMIEAIKYARVGKIPYLGLCYGMQLAVVEYARSVLGLKSASSEEINPATNDPVIHIIPAQKRNLKKRAYGGTMRLGAWDCVLKPGTRVHEIYARYNLFKNKAKRIASERHRHRYEVNNSYVRRLESKGMVISGKSQDEGLVEFVELKNSDHPFFVGTQAHPEYKSRPLSPHPLFLEFLKAAFIHKPLH